MAHFLQSILEILDLPATFEWENVNFKNELIG
jgi:hypothetical protein